METKKGWLRSKVFTRGYVVVLLVSVVSFSAARLIGDCLSAWPDSVILGGAAVVVALIAEFGLEGRHGGMS